jgi:hypothetical protein
VLGVRQFPIPSSMPLWLLNLGETYTRELDAAVTALGGSTPLLDVKVPVLATGGPDNADLVGDRVVPEHAVLASGPCSFHYPVSSISFSSAHLL